MRASLRLLCAAFTLCLASFAAAGWENARFCRLEADRFLLIAGSQRFVLIHGAAWEPADPNQAAALTRWLKSAKLSEDLGQLVTSAPAEHEVPLAGELNVSPGSVSGTQNLTFKIGGIERPPIVLSPSAGGPDVAGSKTFNDVAKAFGKSPSTLLVVLAETTGDVSASEAWKAFAKRLGAKSELFAYLDKTHGLLWIRHGSAEPTKPKPVPPAANQIQTAKDAVPVSADSTWTYGLAGIALVVGGAVGAGIYAVLRGSKGSSSDAVPSGPSDAERETAARNSNLAAEIAALQSYKAYAEAHDAFQLLIDQAVAQAKASETRATQAVEELRAERDKIAALQNEINQLKASDKMVDDLIQWGAYVADRLSELTEKIEHE